MRHPARPTQHIGIQVLDLLRLFRLQLLDRVHELGYTDLRSQHLQVLGYIDAGGTRLTEIAARANVGAPAIAQSVGELQDAGYVVRRPDLTDARAKLVCLTDKGLAVASGVRTAIARMESDYKARVGTERYTAMRGTLRDLLSSLREERQ